MIRTVLFDLDGTLTDSREGIVNSVKYTVEKLGGPMPDPQTLLKFIGPPLQESFMEYCGYSREKALSIIRSQASEEYFRAHADYVIVNNGDLAQTHQQIKEGIK